jgi:8-amino-7-oxononanoate synthase
VTGFASALYLGMRHPHRELRPWEALTAGMPAALAPPDGARAVAGTLAALMGVETAVLGVSSLHLLWDLCGQARGRPLRILADSALYPVGRSAIERAAGAGVAGVAVETFPHHDADRLAKRLAGERRAPLVPLVVTDGLCPDCGRVAPLGRYLALVEARGGFLLLDDSQALGLLGRGPAPARPYGYGGGGSAAFLGVTSPRLLVVASLAKSFGAPLAVLGGAREPLRRFLRASETRMYASPPSVAAVRAAEAALAANRERGDRLRARLAARTRRFAERLGEAGLSLSGGMSPVQNLDLPAGVDALKLYERLRGAGVEAVLRRGACRPGPLLTFVLRADHEDEEIERAAATVLRFIGRRR